MSRASHDGCGCFPTGKHYPGIAHLMRGARVAGLVEGIAADAPWLDQRIALIDVETTGRDSATDRVVELGIVVGERGTIVARYNWLVHPERPIPKEASAIHGINDEDVAGAAKFREIADEVASALEGAIPAAYNASFDRGFIQAEFARAHHHAVTAPVFLRPEIVWFDPLVWARELQKSERSRTLGDVASRLGITIENAHRASDDAEAALRVLYAFATDRRVPTGYGAFVQEQKRIEQAQDEERKRWRSNRG